MHLCFLKEKQAKNTYFLTGITCRCKVETDLQTVCHNNDTLSLTTPSHLNQAGDYCHEKRHIRATGILQKARNFKMPATGPHRRQPYFSSSELTSSLRDHDPIVSAHKEEVR